MTVMTAENVLSHLSHPLGLGQRDKSGFYGTANGTRAGQGSLKALALNVAGQHMGRKRDNRSQVGGAK
jgi:hypothetical protein